MIKKSCYPCVFRQGSRPLVPCAIKLYRTDVKYACWCLYSSSVLGELTNERLRVGNRRSGMTRAEGKLVCIMLVRRKKTKSKSTKWGGVLFYRAKLILLISDKFNSQLLFKSF